jgi:hypothetical protein
MENNEIAYKMLCSLSLQIGDVEKRFETNIEDLLRAISDLGHALIQERDARLTLERNLETALTMLGAMRQSGLAGAMGIAAEQGVKDDLEKARNEYRDSGDAEFDRLRCPPESNAERPAVAAISGIHPWTST